MADATHLVSTDSWADDPLTWFVVSTGKRAACPLRAEGACNAHALDALTELRLPQTSSHGVEEPEFHVHTNERRPASLSLDPPLRRGESSGLEI